MSSSRREDRQHPEPPDQRTPFERDRDRVLYCSAFRRLGGITQVVSADQGAIFHNRLTHSIKVAQIGRRLAQRLVSENPDLEARVHPEVVECACLAHDLGHPPFGHIGEKQLNALVEEHGDADGYEGNAQSFRILTKLAVRFERFDGLNLTRAVLSATLKYPWLRDTSRKDRTKKWGAYSTDHHAFKFAVEDLQPGERSLEASIMDMADDLAYSVHDTEDFHRAAEIPWGNLLISAHVDADTPVKMEGEAAALIADVVNEWWNHPDDAKERAEKALGRLLGILPVSMRDPYQGTRQQRQELRFWTSTLLGRYVCDVRLNSKGDSVELDPSFHDEVRVLKAVTLRYAIRNPALAAQQFGQARILRDLFADLTDGLKNGTAMLPVRFRHLASEWRQSDGNSVRPTAARVVSDCIASMTEEEATVLHQRFRGISIGSVLNPILR